MPSNAKVTTLNAYSVDAVFHGGAGVGEREVGVAIVYAESSEEARELVAGVAGQLGFVLFSATVHPWCFAAGSDRTDYVSFKSNPAHDYAVALASCINVQSISDEDELQSIATRIARTANAIAVQMGGAK